MDILYEKIKEAVIKNTDPEKNSGIFFSAFDKQGNVLLSEGVLQSQKTTLALMEMLYTTYIKNLSNVALIVCDIVQEIREETDYNKLVDLSVQQYGVALFSPEDTSLGVILPHTEGIADIQNAMYVIQKKNNLKGKVKIFVFTTKRFSILS